MSTNPATTTPSLKTSYGKYVTPIKIHIVAETKFALEKVTINSKPQLPPTSSLVQKARNYIQNYLWDYQVNFNQAKQDWLDSMRTNNN
jgi:hypothetical protein